MITCRYYTKLGAGFKLKLTVMLLAHEDHPHFAEEGPRLPLEILLANYALT